MTMTKCEDFPILSEDLDSLDSEQIEEVQYPADRIECHEATQDASA